MTKELATVPLDPIVYALSHAAFGAVALMAMGYVVVLASKLEERDLKAESSKGGDPKNVIRAQGGFPAAPAYVYVYGHKGAEELSTELHMMRLRLTMSYLVCLVAGFLTHSAELRDFVGTEDIAIISSIATLLGLPESLLTPFGFTMHVVVELWRATRKYTQLLSHGRKVR